MHDHAPSQSARIPPVLTGAQLETLIAKLVIVAAATLSHMRAEARHG